MFKKLAGVALRQAGILVGLAMVPAVLTIALDWQWKAPEEFKELGISEAQLLMREIVWVDVRNQERFTQERVRGAIGFDEADPATALKNLRAERTPSKKLVVYGEGSGSERAVRVARLLKKELETKNVLLLKGGWAAWPRGSQTVQRGVDVQ
ncbi:MAG: rhodanese-like domain-containing protein [Verrucomicrobiota bacterium]